MQQSDEPPGNYRQRPVDNHVSKKDVSADSLPDSTCSEEGPGLQLSIAQLDIQEVDMKPNGATFSRPLADFTVVHADSEPALKRRRVSSVDTYPEDRDTKAVAEATIVKCETQPSGKI